MEQARLLLLLRADVARNATAADLVAGAVIVLMGRKTGDGSEDHEPDDLKFNGVHGAGSSSAMATDRRLLEGAISIDLRSVCRSKISAQLREPEVLIGVMAQLMATTSDVPRCPASM
jgi:hypothetical protein